MTERREIKQRPASVWKKVREAYLAGEPAASVARRFDVGLGNLRFKANAEGWTRKAQMAAEEAREAEEAVLLAQPTVIPREAWAMPAAPEPEPDPWTDPAPIDRQVALMSCLDHAARAMAAGEGAKALTAIKAAQAYSEISQTLNLDDPNDPWAGTPDPDGTRPGMLNAIASFREQEKIDAAAEVLAQRMLAERCDGGSGYHRIYHWRARHLGPEVAARDYENAKAEGRTDHVWDENGRLKPLEDVVIREDGKPYRNWIVAPDFGE